MKMSWNLTFFDLQNWGSPLRPSSEDLKNYVQQYSIALSKHRFRHNFLLGVTPELYEIGEFFKFDIFAVDISGDMIKNLWRGLKQNASCDNWINLHKHVHQPSLIVNDGGFHLMTFSEQKKFISLFKNRFLNESYFVCRFFLLNDFGLTSDEIFDKLESGQITNLNELKFLLWSAVDLNREGAIKVNDVWRAISRFCDGRVLERMKLLGFTDASIKSLLFYRQNDAIYYFSSFSRIESMFSDLAGFTSLENCFPKYNLGEYFPVGGFMKESR